MCERKGEQGAGSGRRGVPAAIIRVNYRAVSPFGELLTLSSGWARSLDRSSLNPVANLYHDWTSYRRASMSVERGGETARDDGIHVAQRGVNDYCLIS